MAFLSSSSMYIFFEWKDIMLLSNRRETQKQKHMETNSTAVANLQLESSKSDRDFVLYVVNTYIEKHFEESSNVYLEKEFIDYSGINVPLVAVCNVPPVAQCNVGIVV